MGSGATVRRWRGPDELQHLQQRLRCASPHPAQFQAEERTISGDGVVLHDLLSTELSGVEVRLDGAPAGGTALHLAVVLSGVARWAGDGRRWVGRASTAHLLQADRDLLWSVTHGTRLVRLALPADRLPPQLQPLLAEPSGPLPEGPVTTAFVAAVQQCLTAAAESPGAAVHLLRGLQHIATAALDGLPAVCEGPGPDLRARIVAHIEANLHDRDLGPRSIAGAFSVSLRRVHQAFNTPTTSLARFIRDRRIDAVAAVLREDRRTPRTGALAIRFGFSGREQLARGFRARYGVTVTGYHGLVLDGLPLPEARVDVDARAERRVA